MTGRKWSWSLCVTEWRVDAGTQVLNRNLAMGALHRIKKKPDRKAREQKREAEIMEKLRAAIKSYGIEAPVQKILTFAAVNRNFGLTYLRELEESEKYKGFN